MDRILEEAEHAATIGQARSMVRELGEWWDGVTEEMWDSWPDDHKRILAMRIRRVMRIMGIEPDDEMEG